MKTNIFELIDCIDAMKKLTDNSIDMVCTDPPYFLDGLGDDWNKDKIDKKGSSSMVGNLPKGMKFDRKQSKKFSEFYRKVSDEVFRVLKPGGIFASNMVPRKISIQTIADFERTLVYSCRNLVKGRFSEVFRRVESVPRHFGVNPMPLQGYIDVCRQTQLESVVGLVMTPFPNLALPKVGKILYARFMSEMMPFWQKFNVSKRRWTEICGILYTIYGTKK